MTKKELQKSITKAFCEYINTNFPEYTIDESEGGRLAIVDTTAKNVADNSIEYSRSYHDLCVLNWTSSKVKKDAAVMESYLKQLVEMMNKKYQESK